MKEIRVFNHTLHRELWQWHADNPAAHAREWPGWQEHGISRAEAANIHYCPACACAGMTREWQKQFVDDTGSYSYDMFAAQRNETCCHCPLDWDTATDGHQLCCWEDEGLHNDFVNLSRFDELTEVAEMIRDLPLRDDPDFITIVK